MASPACLPQHENENAADAKMMHLLFQPQTAAAVFRDDKHVAKASP